MLVLAAPFSIAALKCLLIWYVPNTKKKKHMIYTTLQATLF